MTDYSNNIFGNYLNSKNNLDDIIDKKRLEKNMDTFYKNKKKKEKSTGQKILSGVMFLASVIFSIIIIIIITSNLSFLITCGRSLVAMGKDGKKRTFNDLWFPSYYFYQENDKEYPFCQGLKINQNGFLGGSKHFSGLPWDKYSFDFLSWFQRAELGIISDFFNYLSAVSKKTNIINNARIVDLLQIIEYIMPNNAFYRNLILFFTGIPLIFGIILLSGIARIFIYIYNLLTTDYPYNLLYLSFFTIVKLIIINSFFPFIFFIPLEIIFFPITYFIYAIAFPIALIFLMITVASLNSMIFNLFALIKLMFVGYLAGGYKAISKNAQENKYIYMFMVGISLVISILILFI